MPHVRLHPVDERLALHVDPLPRLVGAPELVALQPFPRYARPAEPDPALRVPRAEEVEGVARVVLAHQAAGVAQLRGLELRAVYRPVLLHLLVRGVRGAAPGLCLRVDREAGHLVRAPAVHHAAEALREPVQLQKEDASLGHGGLQVHLDGAELLQAVFAHLVVPVGHAEGLAVPVGREHGEQQQAGEEREVEVEVEGGRLVRLPLPQDDRFDVCLQEGDSPQGRSHPVSLLNQEFACLAVIRETRRDA